jgi:hypothetical protein
VHQTTGPNQVRSWDITWLPATVRGSYLYLYLIMDVWSRRIAGWRIVERESADATAALMRRARSDGNIDPRGLVLRSDNGTPMRGSIMMSTLQLGVVPSFSRAHVTGANAPYSGIATSCMNARAVGISVTTTLSIFRCRQVAHPLISIRGKIHISSAEI